MFGDGLQVRKARLEILADHIVHIDKYTHYFRHVGVGTLHGPGDVRRTFFGFERELGDVMAFKRLEEIEFDGDPGIGRSMISMRPEPALPSLCHA